MAVSASHFVSIVNPQGTLTCHRFGRVVTHPGEATALFGMPSGRSFLRLLHKRGARSLIDVLLVDDEKIGCAVDAEPGRERQVNDSRCTPPRGSWFVRRRHERVPICSRARRMRPVAALCSGNPQWSGVPMFQARKSDCTRTEPSRGRRNGEDRHHSVC